MQTFFVFCLTTCLVLLFDFIVCIIFKLPFWRLFDFDSWR